MDKIVIPMHGCCEYTSKRGTRYLVHNDSGYMLVEREYSERKSTGGFRMIRQIVRPTVEILERYTIEQ